MNRPEERDAYGYTEAQYEAADKQLDREKDDRMEYERDENLRRLGVRALAILRERRSIIQERPQEYELQVALGFDDLVGAARALGLLQ